MSLRDLLNAGAESWASAYVAQALARPGGARGRLTEAVIQRGLNLYAKRTVGYLPGERNEMRQIITAAAQAQRQAARLDDLDDVTGMPRMRARDVGRLPGSPDSHSDRYTYTVRVRTYDSSADGRNSLMVVIRSGQLLPGEIVRARAIMAVETGTAYTRYSYATTNPSLIRPDSVEVVSVYRGEVRASDGL